MIGNGEVTTISTRHVVTGNTDLIPAAVTIVNTTNFPPLTTAETLSKQFNFTAATGEYEFLVTGNISLAVTMNINTSVGNSEVYFYVERYRNSAWEFLKSRSQFLPAIGESQITYVGTIDIIKGELLRFAVLSPNNKASFSTRTITGPSEIPSIIYDFTTFIK